MNTKITTIFIDMDGTICGFKSKSDKKSVESSCPLHKFLYKENINLSNTELNDLIADLIQENYHSWLDNILKRFSVSYDDFWKFIVSYYNKRVFIYQDAINLLIDLKTKYNIKVYPATTNPKFIILAKLALGSMADQNTSKYFNDLYGGEEVITGGKSSASFYKALLVKSNSTKETTLMIGDHEKFDLQFAREAGINKIILPRRDQHENIIYGEDGGIYVKSLEWVNSFLNVHNEVAI